MAEILSEAASDDFDARPALAKALAPHTARIAKQLSKGARLERVRGTIAESLGAVPRRERRVV